MTRRTRHVFYVSGFDPRGERFYRETLRNALTQWQDSTQTALSFDTGKPWTIKHSYGETYIQLLGWDDIIRQYWPKSDTAVSWQTPLFVWRMLRAGTLGALRKTCWPMAQTIVTTTLPATVTLLTGFLLLLAVFAGLQGGLFLLVAVLLGLGALGSFFGGRRLAKRLQSSWTGRILIYAEQFAQNPNPDLLSRLDGFCDRVIFTLEQGEEVLLTGHSFGAVLAPMIAARIALKRPDLVSDSDRFCLLTLGSILPFVAHHPDAEHIRADMKTVNDSGIAWLDVSSPRDGACCALVNPLWFVGLEGEGPKLLNAQFHKTFTAEKLLAGRRVPLEGHFFYLRSVDTPDPTGDLFDWPATLVDPRPVWQRYKARSSQPSYFGE